SWAPRSGASRRSAPARAQPAFPARASRLDGGWLDGSLPDRLYAPGEPLTTMKIFLSAVTGQFKACRDALASDLRAIGCEVKVQEDFQTGPRTLIERLEEYVAQCDRVIALLGDAYGFEASGTALPPVDPPRSYTQWEYFLSMGDRLGGRPPAHPKDLYLYVASDRFLREHSVEQPSEHAERQRRFRDRVLATGKHWASFDTVDQLRAEV